MVQIMAVVKVQEGCGHFILVSGYFVVGVSTSFGGMVFLWGDCLFEGRRVLFLNGADCFFCWGEAFI